jgi:beta-lactamase regulating signal transducer with metallopeptidase domain
MKLTTSILIALCLLLATISIGFSEAAVVMTKAPSHSPSHTSKSTSTVPSNTHSATPKSSHINWTQDCRKFGICLLIVLVLGLVLAAVGYLVYLYCLAKKAALPFAAAKAVWGTRKG